MCRTISSNLRKCSSHIWEARRHSFYHWAPALCVTKPIFYRWTGKLADSSGQPHILQFRNDCYQRPFFSQTFQINELEWYQAANTSMTCPFHFKPASQFCQSHSSFRLESPKSDWAYERDGLPRPLASAKGVQKIACNFVDHFSNNITTAVSWNTRH